MRTDIAGTKGFVQAKTARPSSAIIVLCYQGHC